MNTPTGRWTNLHTESKLTDELKLLIGDGARPEQLVAQKPLKKDEHGQPIIPDGPRPYKYPTLRRLYAPVSESGLSRIGQGEYMQQRLLEELKKIPTPGPIWPGFSIHRNMSFTGILLKLFNIADIDAGSALRRRQDVIDHFGGGWLVDGWRKPNGDERKLCRYIARRLIEQSEMDAESAQGKAA